MALHFSKQEFEKRKIAILNSMNIKERILFEDNHLIIVNKEAKELVQGDKTGDPTLADHLKAYIKVKYKKPGEVYLGIVHRIDRPTSGVVVFTKTSIPFCSTIREVEHTIGTVLS